MWASKSLTTTDSGCGNSDIPEDTSLWTLDRYCEEVEEVRRGLGLDHFVLYGQSWVGVLAMDVCPNIKSILRTCYFYITADIKLLVFASNVEAETNSPSPEKRHETG